IRAAGRAAGPWPERGHERAAPAHQPRLPAPGLPGRGGGRRPGNLRPLVRHVAGAAGRHRLPGRLADEGRQPRVPGRARLGSARARRERYVGEWVPEPLPDPGEWASGRPGGIAADPADRVTLDESVSMAFLVVLESMTPAERVAFVLHDVFGYSFAEVAQV